jgi:hypothetical protein
MNDNSLSNFDKAESNSNMIQLSEDWSLQTSEMKIEKVLFMPTTFK